MTASNGAMVETRRARQGHGAHPVQEALGAARGHVVALLAEKRPDEGNVSGSGAHDRVADGQAAAHMPLGIGQPMRRAVRPEQARLRQRAGVPAVRLHLAGPRRVQRREVGIGDDDLVPQLLETARPPLAVRRGLEQDPRPGPPAEHGREALGLGPDPLLDQLAPLGQNIQIWLSLLCTSMPI